MTARASSSPSSRSRWSPRTRSRRERTPLTYAFQVANDAAFTSMAFSQEGIAQGGDGSTRVVLTKLPGPLAKTYFWRVRASSGTHPGTLRAGTHVQHRPRSRPAGARAGVARIGRARFRATPSLTTNNVQRSGPVTAITYKFDLSDSSTFGRILFTSDGSRAVGSVDDGDREHSVGGRPVLLARSGLRQRQHRLIAGVDVLGVHLQPVQPVAGDDGELALRLRELGRDGKDYEHHVHQGLLRRGLRQAARTQPLA